MSIKKWQISGFDESAAREISKDLGISLFAAKLLTARGIRNSVEADKYLNARAKLSDPFLIADMEKAVDAIRQAIENGEKIAVFGDYDCDGVTASAMLENYLYNSGAEVATYIPERADGYGLSENIVRKMFDDKINLIVTVDNGITAVEESKLIYELGMKLVITDHHQLQDELPKAEAIVDPHRADDGSPFEDYCGAGVAFKLICALEDGDSDFVLEQYGELAAIATVGDIVPLEGENKTIVKEGLRLLENTERPGLLALMKLCGINGKITSTDIAFKLVPRINAAGRFESAFTALNLLRCEDESESEKIAQILCEINSKRKAAEDEIIYDINNQIKSNPSVLYSRVLIFAGRGWHMGVLGIVSARLMEKYQKPVIVLSIEEDTAHGSARSMDSFSMCEALEACSHTLERFGGHHKAAGITLKAENIEAFKEAMSEYTSQIREAPYTVLQADMELLPSEITIENIYDMSLLEPFGEKNPKPVFVINGAKIIFIRGIKEGRFTQIRFDYKGKVFGAVSFKIPFDSFGFAVGDSIDLAVTMDINEYNGAKNISLIINDLKPTGFAWEKYYNARCAYEKIKLGEGYDKKLALRVIPKREDIAVVYKLLRKNELTADSLYYRLWKTNISFCMMMNAIDVLSETGLAEENGGLVRAVSSKAKVNIEESKTLIYLKEEGGV